VENLIPGKSANFRENASKFAGKSANFWQISQKLPGNRQISGEIPREIGQFLVNASFVLLSPEIHFPGATFRDTGKEVRDTGQKPPGHNPTLGHLGFEGAQHRQTLRPSVDGIRSKALRPFGVLEIRTVQIDPIFLGPLGCLLFFLSTFAIRNF